MKTPNGTPMVSPSYEPDRVTPIWAEVVSVTTQVFLTPMGGGQWSYFGAIQYTPPGRTAVGDPYLRHEGRKLSRKAAIESLRVWLHDHFGCVPEIATLRIERSTARLFPADSSRPFSRVRT